MSEHDKLNYSSLIGTLVVCILGSVNHFIYDLSGGSPFAAAFGSVNESLWEHMKLLFFPYALYILIEYFIFGKNIRSFLFSRVTGLLFGLAFIPSAYYIYTGLLGKNLFVLDILIFIAACAISFNISLKRIKNGSDKTRNLTIPAFILLASLAILFVGFTFFPPDAPLFRVVLN